MEQPRCICGVPLEGFALEGGTPALRCPHCGLTLAALRHQTLEALTRYWNQGTTHGELVALADGDADGTYYVTSDYVAQELRNVSRISGTAESAQAFLFDTPETVGLVFTLADGVRIDIEAPLDHVDQLATQLSEISAALLEEVPA